MVRNQVSQAEPQIENPKNLPLPVAAEAILKQMFATYQRVVIKAELGSGFSGSRVFVVQPIRDVPGLPAVIKMAPVALMEKEYRAYREYIRDKLHGAAEIKSEPVLCPDSDWGGLRYHLVGGDIFEIESLYSFCRRASIKDIWHVLEKRLFKCMGPLWQFNYPHPQFNLGASYDRLLPVNLLIEPTLPPPDVPLHLLRSGASIGQPLQQGDYVRLEGFVITEVDRDNQAVTLNLPPPTDGPPVSYRLRLQPVETTSPYQVNDVLDSIEGVVTATRYDLLQTYAQRALRPDFGTAETLTLPGKANVTLPNLLTVLPDILDEPRDVRVACIHGDLNLENILVDPDARDVRLIDFAMARRDHVLHDLLRLETGVVTWLLPEVLAEAGLPPEIIYGLYEQLHNAARLFGHSSAPQRLHPALRETFVILATIRKMAREYLFAPNDWREYYQGLTLYLLGALKFKNLDDMPQAPLPKQVAFWGAAAIQKLLQEQPPREEMAWQPLTAPIDDLTGQALNRSTAARLRIAGAVLITVVAILLLLGSFGASTLIERAIAGSSWWEVKPGEVTIAETAVEQNVIEVARLYLPGVIEDVSLDLAPPDQVDVQGTMFGKEMTLECTLTSADGKIDFEIERLGGIHPYLLGNILSGGVDRGLEIGLEGRSLTVEGLEVGERSLTIKYGRMAPTATRTPTATPRSHRTPTATSAYMYVVQEGDSLSKIAERFGVTVEDLIEANKERYPSLVTDRSIIGIGWELRVPKR